MSGGQDEFITVQMPRSLMEHFEASGFCPNDAIRGHPQTGTAWSTLHIEYDDGSGGDYSTTAMYYVCHWNGEVTKASRPWGEMAGKHDGVFIKAVVEWFQGFTQAKEPRQ